MDKEVVLDTKGDCFLCLTTPSTVSITDSYGTDNVPKYLLTEQNLQNICRYLNINTQFSNLVKGSSKCYNSDAAVYYTANKLFGELSANSNKVEKCEISVSLCINCAAVTNKLSSLCKEMEMIEMMITHQLQKFNDILSVASTISPLKAGEGMSQPLGNIEMKAMVVKNFRKEIKEKSNVFLKLHSMTTTEALHIPETSLDTDIPINRKRFHTSATSNTKEDTDNQRHYDDIDDSPVAKKMCSGSPYPPMSADVTSPASTESLALTENSYYNSMEDADSRLDFSQYKCIRFGDNFQCPFCGDLFSDSGSSPSENGIDNHLVVKHLDKMFCSKATHSLSAAVFQLLYKHVNDSKIANNLFICSVCNKDHKTLDCAAFHFVVEHYKVFVNKLAQIQETKMDNNPPETTVCQDKPIPFNTSSVLEWTKRCGQVEHVSPPPTTTDELLNAVYNLPQNKSTTGANQRVGHQSKGTDLGGLNFHEYMLEIGDKIQCTFCDAKFAKGKSSASAIRLHVACFHPEKLFMYKKSSRIDDLTFSDICRNLIKTELETARISNGGGNNKSSLLLCCNCNKTFTRMHNLKYHCVNSHFEVMAEKLIKLQQNYLEKNSLSKNDAKELRTEILPSPSPISVPLSTTPLEQHHWQQFMSEEQTKPTEPTMPPSTSATQSLLSFPNYNLNNSGNVIQSSYYNNATSAGNSTLASSDMALKSSGINPTCSMNIEQASADSLYHSFFYPGYFQNSTTTLSPSPYSHLLNPGWLSPAAQSFFQSTLPPHHQVGVHDQAPTYLPFPEGQQACSDKNHENERMAQQESIGLRNETISPGYFENLGTCSNHNQSTSESE